MQIGVLRYALMMLMLHTTVAQARGITMKSSSICLLHIPGTGSKPNEVKSFSAEDKLNRGVRTGMLAWHGDVVLPKAVLLRIRMTIECAVWGAYAECTRKGSRVLAMSTMLSSGPVPQGRATYSWIRESVRDPEHSAEHMEPTCHLMIPEANLKRLWCSAHAYT